MMLVGMNPESFAAAARIAAIATHRNRKSGAQVTYLREWSGRAEFREGSKLRRMAVDKFSREYEALATEAPPLPAPRVLVRPVEYKPREVDEVALARQRLTVHGSRRKDLSKVDRDEMALVASIGYCTCCGSTRNLQVAHAPSGLFGKGMSIKGNGGILALLCSADLSTNTLGCHEEIDQHKVPDWSLRYLTAFARTRAAIHDMRNAA